MILTFSDSPRWVFSLLFLTKYSLTILFKQAGLLMYTKAFNPFIPEVEWKILDMPYFYLGKNSSPFSWSKNFLLYFKPFSFWALALADHSLFSSVSLWSICVWNKYCNTVILRHFCSDIRSRKCNDLSEGTTKHDA